MHTSGHIHVKIRCPPATCRIGDWRLAYALGTHGSNFVTFQQVRALAQRVARVCTHHLPPNHHALPPSTRSISSIPFSPSVTTSSIPTSHVQCASRCTGPCVLLIETCKGDKIGAYTSVPKPRTHISMHARTYRHAYTRLQTHTIHPQPLSPIDIPRTHPIRYDHVHWRAPGASSSRLVRRRGGLHLRLQGRSLHGRTMPEPRLHLVVGSNVDFLE